MPHNASTYEDLLMSSDEELFWIEIKVYVPHIVLYFTCCTHSWTHSACPPRDLNLMKIIHTIYVYNIFRSLISWWSFLKPNIVRLQRINNILYALIKCRMNYKNIYFPHNALTKLNHKFRWCFFKTPMTILHQDLNFLMHL